MQIKKSSSASLENQKAIYVLMGFVFVLSLCYVALEWTQHEVTKYEQADMDFLIEEEMDIQQTVQDNTPPPPPPPEAPEVVQDVENINVVENDVETESFDFSSEDNGDDIKIEEAPIVTEVKDEVKEVVKEEKKDEVDEDVVFKIVESKPEFPGGDQALFKYLSENVRYPAVALESGIQGRVICQFTVNKDGSICDVEVLRSAGDASLDKEAIRVIKSMPKWTPGKQRGKPVRVSYTLPVSFKIQN